ncbi:peptidylprolyl isomerase [Ramlibacter sp. AN1133]|uniref:peptidylprolyl isomerase n=1 Tax=Ramlibacter sp. AN1133 TaxID=3133429 RepID=UPI0030C1E02C
MRRLLTALPMLALALALGVAQAQAILAARVNGTGIPQEQVERSFEEELRQRKLNLLQIRNPERVKQMKRAVLDRLIEQELFWQQAQVAGMVASPQEVEQAFQSTLAQFKSQEAFERRLLVEGYTPASYRLLVKKQVSATKYANSVGARESAVSDQEVHQFYLENPEKFGRPRQVRAREIFIKVPPAASDAQRAASRSRAEQLLQAARAGEDFEQLARVHSEAPTRQWGGAMEPFARGQLAKPVEDAAFALAAGQVSAVVGTPQGFHILKVEGIDDEVIVSEEQARAPIRTYLEQRKANAAIEKEAQRLRGAGKVEILLPL